MELNIITSKKGTKVVTATNLHKVLGLPAHYYLRNAVKWVSDVYAFSDDVRKPEEMQDYSIRTFKVSKLRDYYLTIELARLIALTTNSKVKEEVAKCLLEVEGVAPKKEKMTKEQVIAVLELTKTMGFTSKQKEAEKAHHSQFKSTNEEDNKWWNYRANLLGYSAKELRAKMKEIGHNYKGKNIRQMLMYIDRYEIIRMAVMDLFIALGKTKDYAKNMGDLAKYFAKELKIEIWDDANAPVLYANEQSANVVNEAKVTDIGLNILGQQGILNLFTEKKAG